MKHTTPKSEATQTAKPVKKPKLTPTQAKVVRAKIKAEVQDIPQAVVATEVFPNASPASASVMMSRELKKVNVQEALEDALATYNLTPHTLTAVVADALGATKTVIVRDAGAKTPEESANSAFADEVPDHSIRLKAAGMAAQWMGIGKNGDGATNINFINVSRTDKGEFGI